MDDIEVMRLDKLTKEGISLDKMSKVPELSRASNIKSLQDTVEPSKGLRGMTNKIRGNVRSVVLWNQEKKGFSKMVESE